MGHAITFAQQKGGAGKTTVLAHLAAAWAEAGRTVALIDLDPQQSLTRWARLRADPAIAVIESKDYRAGGDIKAAKTQPRLRAGRLPRRRVEPARERDPRERPRDRPLPALGDGRLGARSRSSPPPTSSSGRSASCSTAMPPRLGSLEEVLAALGDNRALLLATQLGNRNGFSKAMLTGRTAPELAAALHRRRRDLPASAPS